MSYPKVSAAIAAALSLLAIGASAVPKLPSGQVVSNVRADPVNAAGQPVKRSGQRVNYAQRQWKAPKALSRLGAAEPQRQAAGLTETPAAWSWTTLGSGIGLSGLLVAQNADATEVYVGTSGGGFASNDAWSALRVSAQGATLTPIFASPTMGSPIVEMLMVPAVAAEPARLSVALQSGHVREYRLSDKQFLREYAGPCVQRGGLQAYAQGNVDGLGVQDEVSVCADQTLAVHQGSRLEWKLAGVGGTQIALGQMDDDVAREIATTSGRVIDAGTRSVQWHRTDGFGARLSAADIDGDGRDELVSADAWSWVWSYDVERRLPKWSIKTPQDITALTLADVDGDGIKDVLVGDGQWGAVHVYDAATGAPKGDIANPEHGTTRIAVADLNRDGRSDILFGAGASSTGADHLYVADWPSKTIVWESADLTGPFIGPQVGDLDGDGSLEIVMVSAGSEAGYGSGRIVVLDARTRSLKALSQPVFDNLAWTGTRDLKLRDINGDGRFEIIIAADILYDGVVEIYRMDAAGQFNRVWRNASLPSGSPFAAVDVADVDGDGIPEVVAGNAVEHTGSPGTFLYAYDIVTGTEKWHTIHMPGGWSGVSHLEISDLDADGALEMVALVPGLGVYVFDGPTHAVEAILDKDGSSLGLSAQGALLVGDPDGAISEYSYDGAAFVRRFSRDVLDGAIEGLSDLGKSGRWIGSDGVLRKLDAKGRVLMQSQPYGLGTGRRTVVLPKSSQVLTCSAKGLLAFPR